MSQKKTTPS